jgi:hypothetical protein
MAAFCGNASSRRINKFWFAGFRIAAVFADFVLFKSLE